MKQGASRAKRNAVGPRLERGVRQHLHFAPERKQSRVPRDYCCCSEGTKSDSWNCSRELAGSSFGQNREPPCSTKCWTIDAAKRIASTCAYHESSP
jgi:hypothetical protein